MRKKSSQEEKRKIELFENEAKEQNAAMKAIAKHQD